MKTVSVMCRQSTWWIMYLVMALFVAIVFSSCESKSGRILPPEKIVILDSQMPSVGSANGYRYKVKRIDHGVVTYIISPFKFESGDTIYHRF